VFSGKLSNTGERLTLAHVTGVPIFSVSYGTRSPWAPTADGAGFSIVPSNPNFNPNPDDAIQWHASAALGGSPGADDPPAGIGRIFINEVLTHTDPPNLDYIELYNP